jgi:hypothetical protein
LLEEAFELLGYGKKATSLPEVQLRALRELVQRLHKKKRGAPATRPRTSDAAEQRERTSDAPARVANTGECAALQSDAPARVTHTTKRATLQNNSAAGNALNELAPARNTHSIELAEVPGAPPPREARASASTMPLPAPQHPTPKGRHVPVQVGRAVWARDASQCGYMDERGRRCTERCGLELHHRKAYALGGSPTEHNLELRCRAHNALAAEEDFGREHMDRMRGCDSAAGSA